MKETSIVCPQCGRRSFHKHDVIYRYCVACHQFHDTMRRVQHDDHCILTFNGYNWRIARVRGHLIELYQGEFADFPLFTATLDIKNVRWDEYRAEAAKMLADRFRVPG